MSSWAIALGNLAAMPSMPAPQVARAGQVRPKRAPRPTCPHCGAPMKLPDGPKPWTHDEDATLMEMLEAGRPRKDIAAALKRPPSSIGSRIDTLGLAIGRRAA